MRKYKVKYGFGKGDFVIIEEGAELEKVLYAWIEKIPVNVRGKMFHGKHIILVEGDYHSYTGWNREYEPTTQEDFLQIERDCPEFESGIENAKAFIGLSGSKIGSGESLKRLS